MIYGNPSLNNRKLIHFNRAGTWRTSMDDKHHLKNYYDEDVNLYNRIDGGSNNGDHHCFHFTFQTVIK